MTATPLFLERFFDNLLFGAKHELHNRDMHISKCQIGPLDVTLEEKVLLEFVKANPKATQEQIAKHIGKSSRTVKRITALCSAEEPQAPEQHEPGGRVYGAEGEARSECVGPGKSDNMASGAQRRKHVASLAARGK